MCLQYSNFHTFLYKLFKNPFSKWVTCYKIIEENPDGSFRSPYFTRNAINEGWLVSNRKFREINDDYNFVNRGIHVYTNKHTARWIYDLVHLTQRPDSHIIRCKALKSDLVKTSGPALKEAVFMKILIPKLDKENKDVFISQSRA